LAGSPDQTSHFILSACFALSGAFEGYFGRFDFSGKDFRRFDSTAGEFKDAKILKAWRKGDGFLLGDDRLGV
jgi:hypothetical protein